MTGLALLVYGALAIFYGTPALSAPRLNKEIMVWPVTVLLLLAYTVGYRLLSQLLSHQTTLSKSDTTGAAQKISRWLSPLSLFGMGAIAIRIY